MRGARRDRLRERERGPPWPGKHGPRSHLCQSLHMNCVSVCGWVYADVSCVPGGCAWRMCLADVPGLCLACAWPVPGLCLACAWPPMPRRGRWHEGAQQSEKARPEGQRQVTDRRGQYRSRGREEREGRSRWLTDGASEGAWGERSSWCAWACEGLAAGECIMRGAAGQARASLAPPFGRALLLSGGVGKEPSGG